MILEERYFERREIHAAIEFAEAGGVAVHRNLDIYHGRRSHRGWLMEAPFLHVIALRPVLEEWLLANGLPVAGIQPEKRRRVAHFDLFGRHAQGLIDRLNAGERIRP